MAYANKNSAEFGGRWCGRERRASRSDLSPVGTYTYYVRYIPTAGGSDAISVIPLTADRLDNSDPNKFKKGHLFRHHIDTGKDVSDSMSW